MAVQVVVQDLGYAQAGVHLDIETDDVRDIETNDVRAEIASLIGSAQPRSTTRLLSRTERPGWDGDASGGDSGQRRLEAQTRIIR